MHEYLLIEITALGRNPVWLRIERAAKRNLMEGKNLNIRSISSRFAADDQVRSTEISRCCLRC